MRRSLLLCPLAFVLSFAACGGAEPSSVKSVVEMGQGSSRPGCAGRVLPPAGFDREPDTSEAVAQLRKPVGEGGLCHGLRFVSKTTTTIYRVASSKHPATRLDGAWSFDPPGKYRDQQRRDFGVCSGWSELDLVITCELPASSHVVVGVGQSVRCGGQGSDGEEEQYPQTSVTRVYVIDAASTLGPARCRVDAWP